MRIGLVGGTFDPIHVGHLVVASVVHHALDLDETRVLVAGDPWMKPNAPVASAAERFAAVDAAVRDLGVGGIVADDTEVRRAGPTYTIDTVAALGDAELFLVLGGDAVPYLDKWHRVDELRARVTLVVVNRPGYDAPPTPGWQSLAVSIPPLDVSSTMVRERLAGGLPVDGLVPAAAMRVLRSHGRYAGAR